MLSDDMLLCFEPKWLNDYANIVTFLGIAPYMH